VPGDDADGIGQWTRGRAFRGALVQIAEDPGSPATSQVTQKDTQRTLDCGEGGSEHSLKLNKLRAIRRSIRGTKVAGRTTPPTSSPTARWFFKLWTQRFVFAADNSKSSSSAAAAIFNCPLYTVNFTVFEPTRRKLFAPKISGGFSRQTSAESVTQVATANSKQQTANSIFGQLTAANCCVPNATAENAHMRNAKRESRQIYNHQKSGESANSEVHREMAGVQKISRNCWSYGTHQRFSRQLPLQPKDICIVAEFYFRQPKQKIIKVGWAWPNPTLSG